MSSLSSRLAALSASLKSTLNLISQLQALTSTTPDQRLDLASQIHDQLKEQEDRLSLLRLEIDTSITPTSSKTRPNPTQNQDPNADTLTRLTSTLSTARTKFRHAQLTAKRNYDTQKRQERETLFHRKQDDPTSLKPQQPNRAALTQDQLALSATTDVTRALRRTHALLQSNLTQSTFASQTLSESQSLLTSLSDSYGGTGDLLTASRSLVGQLVRSNKSDTWYLQTAFYMLCVTIGWLVFRRVVYGPAWWLIWQPLRWGWWVCASLVGAMVGAASRGGNGAVLAPSASVEGGAVTRAGWEHVPRNPEGMSFQSQEVLAKGGGWGGPAQPQASRTARGEQFEGESLVEQIGRAVLGEQRPVEPANSVDVDRTGEDERPEQDGAPRNSKKRMWEEPVGGRGRKDEL